MVKARVLSAALLFVSVALAAGCLPPTAAVPLTHPVFPTGVAVAPDGNHLIVVSSDFDEAFDDGALFSADLARVQARTAQGDDKTIVRDADAYGARAVLIPRLGDRPVFAHADGGDRVYLPVRETNRIIELDVAGNGALSCGTQAAPGTPRCGDSPGALQLPQSDPFNILITNCAAAATASAPANCSVAGTLVDGMTTLLSSSVVTFFQDDASLTGARRMRISGTLDLGANIGGIRSAVLRAAKNGTGAVVIAAADLSNAAGFIGAKLVLFHPTPASDSTSFDVTAATGALSTRDMVLVPQSADNGTTRDALVVVLRPVGAGCCDALARFEIIDNGALPDVKLTAFKDVCKTPTQLAYAPNTASHRIDRVLVTCQDDDTVEAIDPVTLEPTDAVRFVGRGPYGVAVNEVPEPPEAYVSFFGDNSVGVLHLVDGDGQAKLVMRGRIGAQADKPEDGRQ